MNFEPDFEKIIASETADLVNHVCALAGIKDADQMFTIGVAIRTAFRLAMYRSVLVAVEKWHIQNMQFYEDNR